jgi:hypothetical protein
MTMNPRPFVQMILLVSLATLVSVVPVFAQSGQTGKLKIHVSPKQAYVFVDGKAIRDGSQTIDLPAGRHAVGVYNYGYQPNTQSVQIAAGQTGDLDVMLQKSGDAVAGPFADLEFKGHPRAAVLLNGNTPAYFVGHVDEFDNNWIWHQWLLVKPGDYKVTVTQQGHMIWSGPVAVKAGQRAIVDLNHNGAIKTKDFKPGLTLGPQPRFDTGIASAMVPIAPVTAQLSAQQSQISCGQETQLSWKSADAVDTSISNIGNVAASGDRMVSPAHSMTYELVAKGPGGTAEQSATVNVNSQTSASLRLSQPELRYHKIGDKVVQQDSVVLNWSASNGDTVTIQPLGSVAPSGSRMIEADPQQTGNGLINEMVTYRLNASNACGGSASQTATLHIVGSIDPPPPVTLASLFYPTNYPGRKHPDVGLVASQKQTLAVAAATFKNNEQYASQNKLTIIGHADVRGADKYNLALSERRAELVKDYLIAQGIAADRITTRAEGKTEQLDTNEVQKLQSDNPQKPEPWMARGSRATWLAYNRRVDIVLEPGGQESAKAFPNDAPDALILWQRTPPDLKSVESAQARRGGGETQTSSLRSN